MTRGNQRDKDRERAQKRAASAPKKNTKGGKNEGQTLKNKMESDAEIMRAKQQKAADAKNAVAAGGSSKK